MVIVLDNFLQNSILPTPPPEIYISIAMEKSGKGFQLPKSPISEAGARKIYTDVALAGTKEEPASHSFDIYISGGGVFQYSFKFFIHPLTYLQKYYGFNDVPYTEYKGKRNAFLRLNVSIQNRRYSRRDKN